MRRLCLTLLIALLALPTFAEPLELAVMSFNIRYGTANDGDNAWPKRRELVVETIKHFDPDVFGVQECLEFQAEYIGETLKGYRWIGIGRDQNGSGEMTAIFYRTRDLTPIKSENFWLSETPEVPGSQSWDAAITRMATWVRFYHPETDRFFNFVNTHFDHRGREAREQSAKLMATRLDALGSTEPTIVTGDFNATGGDSKPWQAFADAGYSDSWLKAPERKGPETTWSGFKEPDILGTKRIDWVLFKGPVEPLYIEAITYNSDGQYPSDHLPVFARLALSKQ